MKKILIGATLLLWVAFVPNVASAQSPNTDPNEKYNPAKYAIEPLWIDMMKDPDVNFYETVRAFREFWQDKSLPGEPWEKKGGIDYFEIEVGLEHTNESAAEQAESRKRKLQNASFDSYKYMADVKSFKGWLRSTKPWIRQDGSIMTMAERQAIIDQQQRELKEIEKNNTK